MNLKTQAYRAEMADYLRESDRMIRQSLSDAHFDEDFPHIFGRPTEAHPEVSVRNHCGLLLRKAQIHIAAVLRANARDNLHSLAVHMRVILECTIHIASKAHAACKGGSKETNRIINAMEYGFLDASVRLSQGSANRGDVLGAVFEGRETIGRHDRKQPRRVVLADLMKYVASAPSFYDYLSTHFCGDSTPSSEADSFFRGGVGIVTNTTQRDLAFAFFLGCLAHFVGQMLLSNGCLLIAVNGDDQPFEEAIDFLDRRRSAWQKIEKELKSRT